MKIKGFKDTIDWYNKNATQYSKSIKELFSINQIDDFVSLLPKDSLILDAGCAAGRDSKIFFDKEISVIGIDISKSLIEIARKNFPKINFIVGDFRKLPFTDNYFKGVWAHASLVHFDNIVDVKKSLSEFYRVLKKDGIIYISVKKIVNKKFKVVKDILSKHKRFFQYYSELELNTILKDAGFKLIEIKETNDPAGRDVKWLVCLAKK